MSYEAKQPSACPKCGADFGDWRVIGVARARIACGSVISGDGGPVVVLEQSDKCRIAELRQRLSESEFRTNEQIRDKTRILAEYEAVVTELRQRLEAEESRVKELEEIIELQNDLNLGNDLTVSTELKYPRDKTKWFAEWFIGEELQQSGPYPTVWDAIRAALDAKETT